MNINRTKESLEPVLPDIQGHFFFIIKGFT